MTQPDANGWPDPARPGVPANPAQDGWHWLQWVGLFPADKPQPPTQYRWEKDGWWDGSMHRHARYWQGWRYLGPCLPPDEARAQAARVAELEAVVEAAYREGWQEGEAAGYDKAQHDAQGLRQVNPASVDKDWQDSLARAALEPRR